MNYYWNQLMTYYEIHRLFREGHSIARIAKYTRMDWRTIKKYLHMTEQEYEVFIDHAAKRTRKLAPFEPFVLGKLKEFPDTSAAQMHDWLKEHHSDFPKVSAKTVFNFVAHLRQKHHIPKTVPTRQFSMVEELPYGQQAQVDFGEYNMRTSHGKRKKVYFFSMVLSRSRQKYIWFTDQPFTSRLAIQAHEQAFAYFAGVPDEVVYDQDRVFIVSENGGDFILTDEFRKYTRERSFDLYFCRKADPQSKGKIENVIKFIKQNFLYNRTYFNTDTLNDEALSWLGRTANYLEHGTTRKRPMDEMAVEQPFLSPYFPIVVELIPSSYAVRKDNTISYKGNFYSLPLGTFTGKDALVNIHIDGAELIITQPDTQVEICRHLLCTGRGEKIINTDHKRMKSLPIDEMIEELLLMLPRMKKQQEGKIRDWIGQIRADKPRYIRDQLIIISKAIFHRDSELIVSAIEYCIHHHIYSGTDFKDILDSYEKKAAAEHNDEMEPVNPLSGHTDSRVNIEPAKSDIEDYQSIF